MPEGPLSGVRIVELCTWFTGPMAACILADQGADVIKIEPPGGDLFRRTGTTRNGHAAFFMAANRNKRSVMLDLKQADHVQVLEKLIERADVFIQNFKVGVIERMGFGAERLCAKFPRLIYASVSGYGPTGPNSPEGAFDTMIQAASGLASVQGKRNGRPKLVKTLAADKVASPLIAQGITSDLFQRERTGRGCKLDYSMLDGMVWWMWPDAMMNHTFLEDGVERGVDISEVDLIAKTADGYLVATAHQQREWDNFVALVGRPELNEDPKLATERARGVNLDVYTAVLRESFGGRTTEEWCTALRERGIPCAPVLKPEEVASYPQVVWNETIDEVEHPQAGRHRAVRGPVRFDGVAHSVRRPAPAAGADTQEVLAELDIH